MSLFLINQIIPPSSMQSGKHQHLCGFKPTKTLLFLFLFFSRAQAGTPIIEELTSSLPAITSIRIKADIETRHAENTSTAPTLREQWDYTFKEPGLFRIGSVENGVERLIYCDGDFAWEFIPSRKTVFEEDLRGLGEKTRRLKKARAMRKAELPFLFWQEALKNTEKRKTASSHPESLTITGFIRYAGKKSGVTYWIDPKTKDCFRVELIQKGSIVLGLQMSGHEERNGLRLPARMKYTLRHKNDRATVSIRLIEWEINRTYPDDMFTFRRDEENIRVIKP